MQDFNSENLLVFAHRAEAQAFLVEARSIPFLFEGLWQHESWGLVLVCGEGLDSARERLACVLASFPHIQSVYSLGVAGALREQVHPAQIYSVRTCYGEGEFRTYTSSDASASDDCISAKERVLTSERASALDNFAPIVERELWAIAGVCTLLKKQWYAFKLISDAPYSLDTKEQSEICQIVKDEALKWSRALLEFYHLKLHELGQAKTPTSPQTELDLGESFHLTLSLTRQIESLRERVGAQKYLELCDKVKEQDFVRPKDRTVALIHELTRTLNPFRAKLEDKIDEICAPLVRAGIQISYPWPLESAHLNLKIQIQKAQDLERIPTALSEFSFEDFAAVAERGELDV